MSIWQKLFGPRAAPPLRFMPLDSISAPDVSRLHGRGGFARGWSISECEALLADKTVIADGAVSDKGRAGAAVLSRCAADEAEVLIIVVDPDLRRSGIGSRLMVAHCETLLRKGIRRLFLEVEENNLAARALYDRLGFVTAGSRASYYPLPDGGRARALILRCDLEQNLGQNLGRNLGRNLG